MTQPLPPIQSVELLPLLTAKGSVRLLDVREPDEFVSDLGHIAGAELIPLGSLPAQLERLAGETREIISICRSGARAGRAAGLLADRGLKVRVLVGGMLAWNDAKLPISRDPA